MQALPEIRMGAILKPEPAPAGRQDSTMVIKDVSTDVEERKSKVMQEHV